MMRFLLLATLGSASLLVSTEAFTTSRPATTTTTTINSDGRHNSPTKRQHAPTLELTSTYSQIHYPTASSQEQWFLDNVQSIQGQQQQLQDMVDSIATASASFLLDTASAMERMMISSSSSTTTSPSISTQEKLYRLSNDELSQMIQNDIDERNALVTADFSQSIYDDQCRFKDGSNLDGSYPMKPWILGCKLLFKAARSRTELVKETLEVTATKVTFRFASDLEFRGPFSPRVKLTGRVVMIRNALTGLITSYEELWDQNVGDIVRNAQLRLL